MKKKNFHEWKKKFSHYGTKKFPNIEKKNFLSWKKKISYDGKTFIYRLNKSNYLYKLIIF